MDGGLVCLKADREIFFHDFPGDVHVVKLHVINFGIVLGALKLGALEFAAQETEGVGVASGHIGGQDRGIHSAAQHDAQLLSPECIKHFLQLGVDFLGTADLDAVCQRSDRSVFMIESLKKVHVVFFDGTQSQIGTAAIIFVNHGLPPSIYSYCSPALKGMRHDSNYLTSLRSSLRTWRRASVILVLEMPFVYGK